MLKLKIKRHISKLIKSKGKYSFIDSIREHGNLLDVGCGNNSPYIVKTLRPDIHYIGLDIGIYNQTPNYAKYADEFILTEPDTFHSKIEEYSNEFDAIVCSHNLEHCNDYMAVTLAMIQSLRKGGTIYISFPCEESINLPSRRGCLNFYDDDTHKNLIPYSSFISVLKQNGMNILFATRRYRPAIPFLIGLICEPFCRLLNKQAIAGGTWAFYGFETIIIAKKD
jgi:2-polyprenyl-3-methyl-5-hydroxy-6-metoxy-1,4-benzoquinol methylase